VRYLLLFFVLLTGCVVPPEHRPLRPPFAGHTIVMHGDTEFSPNERTILESAVAKWNHLTNGVVRMEIVWDLNATSTSSLIAHQDDNLLLLGHSTTYLGEAADQMSGGKILGWVDHDLPYRFTPSKMFLMMDRLNNKKLWRVALHEFFHVAGMNDNQNPGHLMSKQFNTIECPSVDEMAEFCGVWGCNVGDVVFCD
jgi:hypothetical protein